jgi:hypothetical protein
LPVTLLKNLLTGEVARTVGDQFQSSEWRNSLSALQRQRHRHFPIKSHPFVSRIVERTWNFADTSVLRRKSLPFGGCGEATRPPAIRNFNIRDSGLFLDHK